METSPVDGLRVELAQLQRSRGIHDAGLYERTGPLLRAVADITDADPPSKVWGKLKNMLSPAINSLPPEYIDSARILFAIEDSAGIPVPNLVERYEILARKTGLSSRTIRRRVPELTKLLAWQIFERHRAILNDAKSNLKPRFEAGEQELGMLAPIIESLHGAQSAVIRLGDKLVLKFNDTVVVHTLSSEQQKCLDTNPTALTDPKALLDHLQGAATKTDD